MPNQLPSNDNDPGKLSQQEEYEDDMISIEKKNRENGGDHDQNSIVSEALTHEEDASPMIRNNVDGGTRG